MKRNTTHYQSFVSQDKCSKYSLKNIFAVMALSFVMVMASPVVFYLPAQNVEAQESDDCNTDTQDCYFEDPVACSDEYPGPCGPRECDDGDGDGDGCNQNGGDPENPVEPEGPEPEPYDCNTDTQNCSEYGCVDDGTCDFYERH